MIWSGTCECDWSTDTFYDFTVFGNPVTEEEYANSYKACYDENRSVDPYSTYLSKNDVLTQLR